MNPVFGGSRARIRPAAVTGSVVAFVLALVAFAGVAGAAGANQADGLGDPVRSEVPTGEKAPRVCTFSNNIGPYGETWRVFRSNAGCATAQRIGDRCVRAAGGYGLTFMGRCNKRVRPWRCRDFPYEAKIKCKRGRSSFFAQETDFR